MEMRRAGVAALVVVVVVALLSYEAEGQGLTSVWMDDIAGLSLDVGMESAAPMCEGSVGECDEGEELTMESDVHGRLLRQVRYYISYGALSANRVPCPPRSGRSYYTRNCYSARGPVHPYRRGCTAITRCRRYTS